MVLTQSMGGVVFFIFSLWVIFLKRSKGPYFVLDFPPRKINYRYPWWL